MKLLPLLLLNLATVLVGIVVYDQMRGTKPPPATALSAGAAEDTSVFERLTALERQRAPTLQAAGTDASVLARIAALEEALRAREPSRTGTAEPEPALASRAASALATDEPTKDEIERFRKLRAAVQQQERMKKVAAHVDARLAKLPIKLSQQQRAKIHAAYSDFRPRIGQIWSEAKAQAQETIQAGGAFDSGEMIETTTAKIQQEFARTIDGVVSAADADSIAATVLAGGK